MIGEGLDPDPFPWIHHCLKYADNGKFWLIQAPSTVMDHSTSVFSTFDMDQSGKIRRLHWNERLKISEIAKSESDTSYASEDIALSKDCRRSFVWWGGEGGGGGVGWQVCSPHHTNVCKISRLWEAISSLVFNNSLSNLAILLILRRSFHVVSTNFPNLPTSKIEKKKKKKPWKGLLKT